MTFSVTLEFGSDGSCLAWVHELPGCFVRGASRGDVEAKLPGAIRDFLRWLRKLGEAPGGSGDIDVVVVEEVKSIVETSEDSEALISADREPLTASDWEKVERWLGRSRQDLLVALSALSAEELEFRPKASSRTLRQEVIHIALVELMYAAWTFDLRSQAGLQDLLDWTRSTSLARMRSLAENDHGSVTHAEWAGAPRPEEWTARKAARRLIWHELLHLPALAEAAGEQEDWTS